MTISSENRKVVYIGNSVATSFPIPFIFQNNDHIVLTVETALTGVQVLVTPGLYTITGAGDLAGGTVIYAPAAGALTSAYKLIIERIVPYKQELDIFNQGGFFPETVEKAIDYVVMQTQQLADTVEVLTPDLTIDGLVVIEDGQAVSVPFSAPDFTMASHIADVDPHTQYLLEAQGTRSFATRAAVAATDLSALPVGTEIYIRGHTIEGKGGAAYRKLAAAPVPVETWHLASSDGAYFTLDEFEGNAAMFGAALTGIVDDVVFFEQLYKAWIAGVFNEIDITGEYGFSRKAVVEGPASPTYFKDKRVRGIARIYALAQMSFMIEISNFFDVHLGYFHFYGVPKGTAAYVFADRLAGHGLHAKGLRFCGLGVTGWWLRGNVYANTGVDAPTLSNCNRIEYINSYWCGSGDGTDNAAAGDVVGTRNFAATCSNRVDDAIIAFNQTSTFDVDRLPLAAELDWTPARPVPVFVSFAGGDGYSDFYKVVSWDRTPGANKITISPSPPATVLSGNMRFVFGGAYLAMGQDANIDTVDYISCVGNGITANLANNYLPHIKQLHQASNSIGVVIGADLTSLSVGTAISNMYSEGTTRKAIVRLNTSNPTANNGYINAAPISIDQVQIFGGFRTDSGGGIHGGTFVRPLQGLRGIKCNFNGVDLPEGLGREGHNVADAEGQYVERWLLDLQKPYHLLAQDTVANTPFITIVPFGTLLDELFILDNMKFSVIGNGSIANRAPLQVTVKPPPGWGINGGAINANAVFSNFEGPTQFEVKVMWGTSNLIIARLGSAKETGWTADTGTAKKTANATYSGSASAVYTQAEMTGVMNALRDATQTIKAIKDALINQNRFGT